METKGHALVVVPLLVGVLSGTFAVVGYFVGGTLGIPHRLHIPTAIRLSGIVVLALGFYFMGWVFKYRKPLAILTSTYVTMWKSIKRTSPREVPSKTEPLILHGPQRHVRHPLYFALVVLLLGWWLLLNYTFLLIMALLFFLWFTFVVIRFEEQELRLLFGDEFEVYSRTVPRMLPSLKPRWPLTNQRTENVV